jgi:hypothetical protein
VTLNARFPQYLIEVAAWAMQAHDPRAAAWLARRLPGEGEPVSDRLTLMPWPLPEHFGLLARAPVLVDNWHIGEGRMVSLVGIDWADDLEAKAAGSMAMLQAASRADESIISEDLMPPAETALVRDWLNALPETDPRMLDKLHKVTWEQAIQHSLAYHRRLAKRTIRIAGDDGAVDPLPTVDGHRWLHLVTPAALDRESEAMGHCVGDGGYDHATWAAGPDGMPVQPADPMDALMGLWSLRDGDGRSVLTVEVDLGCLGQCKRRFNDAPTPEYVPHLAVLIAHLSNTMPDFALPDWLVTDVRDGSLHHLHEMPDGIHLADGHYLDPGDWRRIPALMRIEGGTILSHHGEEKIEFRDLHVLGKLAVHGNVVFDGGLTVEGDLDLSRAEDKTVPEGAHVLGKVITERAGAGKYEPFMRAAIAVMTEEMGLTYEQVTADWRGVGGVEHLPRHLHGAPHYRRIEHRGGRRRIA